MAGYLPKKPEDFHPIPGAKIAIIASMWHTSYVDKMIARTTTELTRLQVDANEIQIHRVPGSLELPIAARTLLETDPSLDAIIAFGVVLKGGTTHDSTVIDSVVRGFAHVSDRFGKLIVNEVIGVTDLKDAEARSNEDHANKGLEAAFAVSEFLYWQRSVRRPKV